MDDVRRRDQERLELQLAEGIFAGRDLMRGARPVPTPLSPPKRPSQTFNEEGEAVGETDSRDAKERDPDKEDAA